MKTRRRGQALTAAIMAVVRSILSEQGYAGVTFDGVAAAAATSKTVLYRRWRTKAELVAAALIDGSGDWEFDIPDTGSLKGDIIELLRIRRDLSAAQPRSGSLGLLAELDRSAEAAIVPLLFARHTEWLDPILDRARLRGELGPAPLRPRVLSLPFDLLRHDLLLIGRMLDEDVREMVEACVVPLFVAQSQGTARTGEVRCD